MSSEGESSEYLFKGPCEKCGSRDNCATYSDSHRFCFGCGFYDKGDGSSTTTRSRRVAENFTPLITQQFDAPVRGIGEETLRHFQYTHGRDSAGNPIQIAPYYKDGQLVAQHCRRKDKTFFWAGDAKGVELFGEHLWRDGGKKVVITEGEIDAMSLSHVQQNRWPVVSLPGGAQGARKALAANLEWLEKFEEVVLMFDMDDPGQQAVSDCTDLFTPGKCKVARLPLKDANEMLQARRGAEIVDAIWGAKEFRPDGILSSDDLEEEAAADIPEGTPWFLPSLTEATHGRRLGELYALGAGTGVGKTDWFTQSIAFDIRAGIRVGALYLEQPAVETVRRVAGKLTGQHLHVPGAVTPDQRRAALETLRLAGGFQLYNSTGVSEWDIIKAKLRFMAVGQGCQHIYLDHLTALTAGEEDERRALDAIMAELASLALELMVCIHFISHLSSPEGKSHEEGGRVQIKQFRGSRAIGMWSHFMFGIERDQQAEDAADGAAVFRVLKDRNTGQATGKTIRLAYDPLTGLISEADPLDGLFSDTTKGVQF
jgi:twinkle protein